jgi:hypothetical protein
VRLRIKGGGRGGILILTGFIAVLLFVLGPLPLCVPMCPSFKTLSNKPRTLAFLLAYSYELYW